MTIPVHGSTKNPLACCMVGATDPMREQRNGYTIGMPLHKKTFAWDVRLTDEDGRLVRVSRRMLAVIPKRSPTVPLGGDPAAMVSTLILRSGSRLIGQGAFEAVG